MGAAEKIKEIEEEMAVRLCCRSRLAVLLARLTWVCGITEDAEEQGDRVPRRPSAHLLRRQGRVRLC
jgi:hypothetical protein